MRPGPRPPRILDGALAVRGTGTAFPGPAVSNDDMVRFMGLRASEHQSAFVGMIAEQLGMRQRFLSRDLAAAQELPRPGDTNPEICERAVRSALEDADLTTDDVDLLIGHTTSPHTLLPPNVAWLADRLDWGGHFMELRQACTGFANALMIAGPMLTSGAADCVVIVGSETGSVLLNLDDVLADRGQLVNVAQMGDGAGAVVLTRADPDRPQDARLDHIYFGSLGLAKPSGFSLAIGGSSRPSHFRAEDGGPNGFHNDYRLARDEGLDLFVAGFDALASVGLGRDQVTRYLSHQANGRMPEVLSPLLDVPVERFHNCASTYGNTGSASTWIGLHTVREQGLLQPGEVLGVLGAEATKFMYGGFAYVEGTKAGV